MEGHKPPLQLYSGELGGTQDFSREGKEMCSKMAICPAGLCHPEYVSFVLLWNTFVALHPLLLATTALFLLFGFFDRL